MPEDGIAYFLIRCYTVQKNNGKLRNAAAVRNWRQEGMERRLFLLKGGTNQTEAFAGLVMPDVLDRLEDPEVFLIGAVDGNTPVGAAVLEVWQGRAQLLSIAVAEDHRRKGVGSALIRHCVRMLRRTSVSALYAVLMPEETRTAALFAAQGMTDTESGAFYRFTPDALSSTLR